MFTHKKIKEIRRGQAVPNGAKYLRTETKHILVAEGPHPQYDIYDNVLVDLYEIPCNEDGTTELKVTYERQTFESTGSIPDRDICFGACSC